MVKTGVALDPTAHSAGGVLPPRRYLGMSGDSFDQHNWIGGVLLLAPSGEKWEVMLSTRKCIRQPPQHLPTTTAIVL